MSLSHRAILAAASFVAVAAQGQSADHRTLAGDASIYNVAGTVHVVAGTGSDIVVDVARRGRDASKLRVEQSEVRGRQAVRVVFPNDDIVYPALGNGTRVRTRIRADGTFHDTDTGGFFSGRQILVHGSGSGTEAWADVTVSVPTGRSLHIHLIAGDANVTNVDGDLSIDVDAATVTTERTRGRLAIDAGSGRVRIMGAQGDVDLDAGSGAMDIRDLDVKRLHVDGGSGDLVGGNLVAGSVDLDLGSGGARLAKVSTRQLKLDAGSGAVDLEFATDVDDVRIDSGSGAVTLRIPPVLGASLDIDTGSGGIESELPITVTRRERDHLTGRIGDGAGKIVVDGGSGVVRLRKS
jgi:DUF4097 and DUF4098 domain-containing protein YvlB